MVLKVLKLIFVDDIDPSHILITTFTKKAASEIRSRILGWGDILKSSFISNCSDDVKTELERVDINRVLTGTLDSISQEILGEFREPGTPNPAVIEDFVSNALMVRVGLFNEGRFLDEDLKNAIADLKGSKWGINVPGMSETLLEVKERLYHDQIDFEDIKAYDDKGFKIICKAIEDYILELKNRFLFDFAALEQEFLTKLLEGKLNSFLKDIKFVLVDEYQDY